MGGRLLRARDRAPAPWKNGGGITHEIAAFPEGADLESFDWRVSMATVSAGGPFSIFPGIDRILTVLNGVLDLDVDGKAVQLVAASEPYAFPGDIAVRAATPRLPVTDLNVMTRRGRARARVTRLEAPASIAWNAATRLILSLSVRGFVRLADGAHALGPFDAVLVGREDAGTIALEAKGRAPFILVEFARSLIPRWVVGRPPHRFPRRRPKPMRWPYPWRRRCLSERATINWTCRGYRDEAGQLCLSLGRGRDAAARPRPGEGPSRHFE